MIVKVSLAPFIPFHLATFYTFRSSPIVLRSQHIIFFAVVVVVVVVVVVLCNGVNFSSLKWTANQEKIMVYWSSFLNTCRLLNLRTCTSIRLCARFIAYVSHAN